TARPLRDFRKSVLEQPSTQKHHSKKYQTGKPSPRKNRYQPVTLTVSDTVEAAELATRAQTKPAQASESNPTMLATNGMQNPMGGQHAQNPNRQVLRDRQPSKSSSEDTIPDLSPQELTFQPSTQKKSSATHFVSKNKKFVATKLPSQAVYSQKRSQRKQSENNPPLVSLSPSVQLKSPPAEMVAPNSEPAMALHLVERLTQEKDQLYKKLVETEKLNSHLYSANGLFNKKVRELTAQLKTLKAAVDETEKFQLMDDKAKLHKQLIDVEKLGQYKQEEILNLKIALDEKTKALEEAKAKLALANQAFSAHHFCGDWMESGTLADVVYDNFGIAIEPERIRLFRISEPPERLYGKTMIISTNYQYDTNTIWKRDETLIVNFIDSNTLRGEVLVEYIMDGVPVAKAVYQVTCSRSV
ncbi:MAG: hypothetical protein AAGI66_09565, partial [Cyanobacteria bacterium P01_H01_bin.74]